MCFSNQPGSDDFLRAIASLKPLGGGYVVLEVNQRKFLRSVPKVLSQDATQVLKVSEVKKSV